MVSLVLATALGFATYLVEQGEPALAVLELQRELDFNPDATEARALLFTLDMRLRRWDDARRVAVTPLQQAELAEAEGRYGEAFAAYRLAPARDFLAFSLRRRWWAQAEETATSLGDLDLARALVAWRAQERLNPDAAKVMSALLPGAGQFYAGVPASGWGALGVNGVMAGVTAWALLRQDWVGAATVLGYGSRYYFGGIQHAGRFVELRLDREDDEFVAGLAISRPWLRRPAIIPSERP
ncbi:MAG: hypothetical protein JWM80_3361 [Cyanobacteria bacterium RYN_339]|nr:hypothetical protein [Cyanobacteria bacterium RYN_339]